MPRIIPDQISAEDRSALISALKRSRHFLVLGLGVRAATEERPLPETVSSCDDPQVRLKVLSLAGKERSRVPRGYTYNERLCIEVKERGSSKSRLAIARKVLSGISGLFSHVHHWTNDELAVFQFPKELIEGTAVSIEALQNLEPLMEMRQGEVQERLGSFTVIPDEDIGVILFLLPFVLEDESLFNACSFFQSCCKEYRFMGRGVVGEILYQPKRTAEVETERLAFENVILQALRVIEALVGEPGNEKRFRERLKERGLDYDERVGFSRRRQQKLGERILWLQEARDSAAAHGRRRRHHPFTIFEAMEAQHLADHVLHRSLWAAADSRGRTGEDGEIGFLLSEMYFLEEETPGWVLDSERFGGKNAVELARVPGGLGTIIKDMKNRDM
jgi:hypothetical protein